MRVLAPLALVLLLLAGCAQPPLSTTVAGAGPTDPADASPPEGERAGTATTHGTPERTESPVTVEREGARYVARRNVTVSNDFGGAEAATLALATRNGAVTAQPSADGGYRLLARLEARGDTEGAARETLAALEVVTSDRLDGSLALSMEVRYREPAPVELPVRLGDQASWGASLAAWLPPEPTLSVQARTQNGPVTVQGLHGPEADLATTNGGIALEGAWQLARLATTNGGISVRGTAANVQAATTNGAVSGAVAVPGSGEHRLAATNGPISWVLAVREGQGYAVEASTTNGKVTVDLPGLQGSGGEFSGRTPGYEAADAQVAIEATTTNGPVTLAGR